mmetsp:Transcript_9882/g.60227  ORF Transcript_9882/g.60227 Transcript_9882/m.60227 type:complete len:205 (+) Transcript_9882:2823-3437(+)
MQRDPVIRLQGVRVALRKRTSQGHVLHACDVLRQVGFERPPQEMEGTSGPQHGHGAARILLRDALLLLVQQHVFHVAMAMAKRRDLVHVAQQVGLGRRESHAEASKHANHGVHDADPRVHVHATCTCVVRRQRSVQGVREGRQRARYVRHARPVVVVVFVVFVFVVARVDPIVHRTSRQSTCESRWRCMCAMAVRLFVRHRHET